MYIGYVKFRAVQSNSKQYDSKKPILEANFQHFSKLKKEHYSAKNVLQNRALHFKNTFKIDYSYRFIDFSTQIVKLILQTRQKYWLF
jgi:hypothetical protein